MAKREIHYRMDTDVVSGLEAGMETILVLTGRRSRSRVRHRLGRIRGPWRYDDSSAARGLGIHHVRPTVWSPRRFGDDDVPAAVARTFARGGRNLQRTHDHEAERQTVAAWNRYGA